MPLRMSLPRPGEPSWPGENRTGLLFPITTNRNVCQMDRISRDGPCSGGALPVDQANPNSVVGTLQRISRSRKRVTVLRQKDVRMVKTILCVTPFPTAYAVIGILEDRGERSGH